MLYNYCLISIKVSLYFHRSSSSHISYKMEHATYQYIYRILSIELIYLCSKRHQTMLSLCHNLLYWFHYRMTESSGYGSNSSTTLTPLGSGPTPSSPQSTMGQSPNNGYPPHLNQQQQHHLRHVSFFIVKN